MGKREPSPPKATPPAEDRRSFVTLPLAQLVPGVTRTAFRKRSAAGANLMADWASVVGPRLAAATEPRRLSRGQLTIACAGTMAMELQHVATELMQRINTYAGSQVVDRLRFVQDQVSAPAATLPRRRSVPVEPIPGLSGDLHDALAGLLAAIRSQAK